MFIVYVIARITLSVIVQAKTLLSVKEITTAEQHLRTWIFLGKRAFMILLFVTIGTRPNWLLK